MFLGKPFSIIVLAALPLLAAGPGQTGSGLVVHEWGTFTSVAGQGGEAVYWLPLKGFSDLPCFVHRLGGQNIKVASATVRMETPVIYFYTPHPMRASVHVDFPGGLITEWYPQATLVSPDTHPLAGRVNLDPQIEWDSVRISPDDFPDFPAEDGASRYYAARETDSAVVHAGQEQEKLIFYRGIGNFSVPLQPAIAGESYVKVRNSGPAAIPFLVLFENRGGQVGYRITRGLEKSVDLEMPELTADAATVGEELETALVDAGLFAKEARAMLETWRDSWFEEGTRVLYIVPRATVDSVLPITIQPAPSEITRVFVGRVEVLTPRSEEDIEAALATGDVQTLQHYGRFLEAFIGQITQKQGQVPRSPASTAFLESARANVQELFDAPGCSR